MLSRAVILAVVLLRRLIVMLLGLLCHRVHSSGSSWAIAIYRRSILLIVARMPA